MNSFQYDETHITKDELMVLQGRKAVEEVGTLSEHEQLAIQYAKLVSQTLLQFPRSFIEELKRHFNKREIVILDSRAARVNY